MENKPARFLFPTLLVLAANWSAARADHDKDATEKPAIRLPGLGDHNHPIHTSSKEARKFFDQGLMLCYGFNHGYAVSSFRRAAELDPKAAMPHWGIAFALGPNYNRAIDPIDCDRNKAAYDAAQKAVALSKDGPERERDYILALAKRYSLDAKADGHKLEVDFKDALRDLVKKYPDDLDAATLYAESMMDLRPWQLWSKDGKPAEDTEEIVKVLESVLRRHPDHPGANHLYIHAIEASPTPERGLMSAARLPRLAPGAGHLVHMTAHIYTHTGDYELLVKTNQDAVKADEEFSKLTGVNGGTYMMMYYPHNLHFIAVARAAQGRYDEAKQAADKLAKVIAPHATEMQSFLTVPLQVQLRCYRWDEVLQAPEPDAKLPVVKAFRHYARGVAFARKGEKKQAETERAAFQTARKNVPDNAIWGPNKVAPVLDVAAAVLDAQLAPDGKAAINHLEKAVSLEDALGYAEPTDWYYPVRESLGAALLRDGQAAEAEKLFRDDLKRNRRNGRSLFGLLECLMVQKKADAPLVRLEFERVWQKARPLRMEDY